MILRRGVQRYWGYAVVVAAMLVTACSGADGPDADGGRTSGTRLGGVAHGPVAVADLPPSGNRARIEGSLSVDSRCVALSVNGESVLLVWAKGTVDFDPVRLLLRTTDSKGVPLLLRDGVRVSIGGGASSESESSQPKDEWIATVPWVRRPAIDCVTPIRWFVGSVALVDSGNVGGS